MTKRRVICGTIYIFYDQSGSCGFWGIVIPTRGGNSLEQNSNLLVGPANNRIFVELCHYDLAHLLVSAAAIRQITVIESHFLKKPLSKYCPGWFISGRHYFPSLAQLLQSMRVKRKAKLLRLLFPAISFFVTDCENEREYILIIFLNNRMAIVAAAQKANIWLRHRDMLIKCSCDSPYQIYGQLE